MVSEPITAPIPITMPSMVKIERVRLAQIASKALTSVMPSTLLCPRPCSRNSCIILFNAPPPPGGDWMELFGLVCIELPTQVVSLFGAYCHNRVQARCPDRRIDAKDQCDPR